MYQSSVAGYCLEGSRWPDCSCVHWSPLHVREDKRAALERSQQQSIVNEATITKYIAEQYERDRLEGDPEKK